MTNKQIFVLSCLFMSQANGFESFEDIVLEDDRFSEDIDFLFNEGYIDEKGLTAKGYNTIQTAPGKLSDKQVGIRTNLYQSYLLNKGNYNNLLCFNEETQRRIVSVLTENLARLEDQNRYSLLEEFQETVPVEEAPVEEPVEVIVLTKEKKTKKTKNV